MVTPDKQSISQVQVVSLEEVDGRWYAWLADTDGSRKVKVGPISQSVYESARDIARFATSWKGESTRNHPQSLQCRTAVPITVDAHSTYRLAPPRVVRDNWQDEPHGWSGQVGRQVPAPVVPPEKPRPKRTRGPKRRNVGPYAVVATRLGADATPGEITAAIESDEQLREELQAVGMCVTDKETVQNMADSYRRRELRNQKRRAA